MTAALQGIRAKVTDKAPWTMLGLGVGAIWLAVMFVSIFAPVWVTGTDPDRIPFWAGFSAIAGIILTWILCRFVKTASFESAESMVGSTTTTPTVDLEPAAEPRPRSKNAERDHLEQKHPGWQVWYVALALGGVLCCGASWSP